MIMNENIFRTGPPAWSLHAADRVDGPRFRGHRRAAVSLGGLGGASWPGRSASLPLTKVAPARTSATRCGALTIRQRRCADSISLNAIASPAAFDPWPLVTFVRSLHRGEGRLDRVGRAQVHPVLGRVVVERQQFLLIAR